MSATLRLLNLQYKELISIFNNDIRGRVQRIWHFCRKCLSRSKLILVVWTRRNPRQNP